MIMILVVFWIALSGIFTPLILCFGIVSCALVAWIAHRMDLFDHEVHPVKVHPVRFLGYCMWLLIEVVKSNLSVSKTILDPKLPIHPRLVSIKTSQKTELAQVIYANSITLTPGTVSINLIGDEILVHALTAESAEALVQGDMDQRVSAVEHSRSGNEISAPR